MSFLKKVNFYKEYKDNKSLGKATGLQWVINNVVAQGCFELFSEAINLKHLFQIVW